MRSGFGVWFFALEIDYEEEHKKTRTCLEKIIKGIKKKKKKREERHSFNLFCFDVFSYKESTRKI